MVSEKKATEAKNTTKGKKSRQDGSLDEESDESNIGEATVWNQKSSLFLIDFCVEVRNVLPRWHRPLYYLRQDYVVAYKNKKCGALKFCVQGTDYYESFNVKCRRCISDGDKQLPEIPEVMRR